MPTVLIADSDEEASGLLAETLRTENCDVVEARGGADAIEQAVRTRPDIIFLDVNMPDIKGRELLSTIRSDPALRHMPVVLLSELLESDECYHNTGAFPSGYTIFLLKPVRTMDLLMLVRSMLRPERLEKNRVKARQAIQMEYPRDTTIPQASDVQKHTPS